MHKLYFNTKMSNNSPLNDTGGSIAISINTSNFEKKRLSLNCDSKNRLLLQ